jgi:hypothetical protein
VNRLDFYKATPHAIPDTRRVISCPYHRRWVRFDATYRTCPECRFCVRCRLLNRPVYFDHYHRNIW